MLLNITWACLQLIHRGLDSLCTQTLVSFSLKLVFLLYLSLVLHVVEMFAVVLVSHGKLLNLLFLATYRLSQL